MKFDDEPTPPSDILGQFAEGALAHIEMRSVTRFQATLREMREYHRLLLGLYGTLDDDGQIGSYALLEEGYGPIHRGWMNPYRALIARAVSKLDDDQEYFGTIAYLSYGLLAGERRLAPQLVHDLLRFGPITVFRLEEWLSRRAAALGKERGPDTGVLLVGTDHRIYEDALMTFVAAWEATARTKNTFDRREALPADEEGQWQKFRDDWAGMRAHLDATASIFVIAAWNQDEAGMERFADLLLRWPINLHLDGDVHAAAQPWLVTGDVLDLGWADAQASVSHLMHPDPWEALTPAGLFRLVITNLHNQIVLLVAGVVLNWALTGKGGLFAERAARRLINNELLDSDEPAPARRQGGTGFLDRLRTIVALETAGPAYQDAGYGAALDRLVGSLDNVSERRVTTGRVYTPSTVHGRDDLTHALDLILLASARVQAGRAGLNVIREVVDADTTSGAAMKRRGLISRLQRLHHTVTLIDHDTLVRLERLDENVASLTASDEGRRLAEDAIAYLNAVQNRSIAEAAVSPKRLAAFEDKIQADLLDSENIALFDRVAVGLFDTLQAADRSFDFLGLSKNEFLDPEIENQSSNYIEVFAGDAAQRLLQPLWAEFRSLPAHTVTLQSKPDTVRFWKTAEARAAALGDDYLIVLSDEAQALFERRWPFGNPTDELDVVYERGQDRSTYRRTVAGRRVHQVTFGTAMEAFLVPRNLLAEVRYHRQNNGKAVVGEWIPNREVPTSGGIRIRYAPVYTWRQAEIVRIRFHQ